MKKLLFFSLLCLAQGFTYAQTDQVIIGTVDTIESTILNEQRRLLIHVPEGSDENVFTKKTYPVLYLLDGGGHFNSTVGMLHQLSKINGNTICPEMIVVGILNTNRTRDLTPYKTTPAETPMLPPQMAAQTGGGDNFMAFVEKELIPHIEAKYPTEPYKVFVGHSFGGLTVLNTFLKKPTLFNAYVSLDPSMSFHNKKLLQAIKTKDLGKDYKNRFLYLGIANTLTAGLDTETVRKDRNPMNGNIRANLELHDYLTENHGELSYRGKYYPEDDHGSVPFIAGYDAMRYIFAAHRLKIGAEDVFTPTINVAKKIETHYRELSNVFGYEKKPAEDYLNNMGYQLMQMNLLDKAEDFFALNVTYYPDRFNVYDSLGDVYVAKGDKEKVVQNFKKALAINPESTFTKEKLVELEKE